MTNPLKYAVVGAVLGAIAAAVSANPLTVFDLILGGAILAAIGFGLGKYKDRKASK